MHDNLLIRRALGFPDSQLEKAKLSHNEPKLINNYPKIIPWAAQGGRARAHPRPPATPLARPRARARERARAPSVLSPPVSHTLSTPLTPRLATRHSSGLALRAHPILHPHRIRFDGKASVDAKDPLLAEYPEAQLIVRVSLTKMWVNCPRYIPILTKQADSKFVPDEAKSTPLPAWKRIDAMQDVLPKNDQALVANGPGVIKAEDYPDALEDDKAPS